jgi:hypothetical protein
MRGHSFWVESSRFVDEVVYGGRLAMSEQAEDTGNGVYEYGRRQ